MFCERFLVHSKAEQDSLQLRPCLGPPQQLPLRLATLLALYGSTSSSRRATGGGVSRSHETNLCEDNEPWVELVALLRPFRITLDQESC